MIYEYRLLPILSKKILSTYEINDYIEYWGNSNSIRSKVKETNNTKTSITVFLEYIPNTLNLLLEEKLQAGDESASKTISMIENDLNSTIEFMKKKGMVHFDATKNNLLTDGQRLYFADFGLTLSSTFNLSKKERDFFDKHQTYDKCQAIWFTYGKIHNVYQSMSKLVKVNSIKPKKVKEFFKCYHSIANRMEKFFIELRTDKSKTVPYPTDIFNSLCIEADLYKKNLDSKPLIKTYPI